MLLKDYIDSPPIKGGLRINTNEIVAEKMMEYKQYRSRITSKRYNIDNSIFVHVRIPSASVKDFYYDAVVQFIILGKTLEESKVKVFSNSPSFIYNYAYIFYHYMDDDDKNLMIDQYEQKIPKESLMIKSLSGKAGEAALTILPEQKNPHGIPLLDKSLYFAMFHILEKYNVRTIKYGAFRGTRNFFDKQIMSFEKTMLLRTKLQQLATARAVDNIVVANKDKQTIKKAIDKGHNVNIRYTKKHGVKVRIRPSTAVNNLKAKAGSMKINTIKKLK